MLGMGTYSTIVLKGMDRICNDFSLRIESHGFTRTKKRLWTRQRGAWVETIYFQKRGSSYGSPRTPSVDLRVTIGLSTQGGRAVDEFWLISDHARRSSGYAYHHRFNADTWSTYERCLEELLLFVDEIAEPWFGVRGSAPLP